MKSIIYLYFGLSALAAVAAGRGNGPVMEKCKAEIEKFCPDKAHVRGEVRACLEKKKEQLSAACREALETTGPRGGRRGN
jgi:hypothetical protein